MQVKVYSADWCPYCHALMNWLDSLGVKYEEIDADTFVHDPDSDINALPVTEIANQRIVGFDRVAIKKALKAAGAL